MIKLNPDETKLLQQATLIQVQNELKRIKLYHQKLIKREIELNRATQLLYYNQIKLNRYDTF